MVVVLLPSVFAALVVSTTWSPDDEGPLMALDLRTALEVPIDAGTKGFPVLDEPLAVGDVATRGWTLADLRSPAMVLREDALEHNLSSMASFCGERGVDLAPHGKTTMAPQLWDRQLGAGAWGITAAGVAHAAVMRAVGVPRVVIANEVVDAPSIAWIAGALADPAFDLIGYVDSLRGVSLLHDGLVASDAPRPLRVLVELGHEGGRTGIRATEDALRVAEAVGRSDRLELAGAAGYEGTIGDDRSAETLAAVAAFVDRLRDLVAVLIDRGVVGDEVIVSAGGSVFFDIVAERLRAAWPAGGGVRVVLRSGCYLTHDDGIYERNSPFVDADPERRFRPAIELWGRVLSRPEPTLAILSFGKRDAPFDTGPPLPKSSVAGNGERIDVRGAMEVARLQDQHAFCRVDPDLPLEAGNLVVCGISHPCAAFDRWRVIPVVDRDDRVVDAVATFF
jgi:D-serine deaminase-like pyridoxal phosphate-dependent protein